VVPLQLVEEIVAGCSQSPSRCAVLIGKADSHGAIGWQEGGPSRASAELVLSRAVLQLHRYMVDGLRW